MASTARAAKADHLTVKEDSYLSLTRIRPIESRALLIYCYREVVVYIFSPETMHCNIHKFMLPDTPYPFEHYSKQNLIPLLRHSLSPPTHLSPT